MKSHTLAIGALLIGLLSSCERMANVSNEPIYRGIVGHPLKLKTSMGLHPINYSVVGYWDRYGLGDIHVGQPRIAVLPAGLPVQFDRAARHIGIDGGGDSLEGVIHFGGKDYPVAYSSDYYEGDPHSEDRFWKKFGSTFAIVR